jgi:sugar phosphate isomerase/epimerase
MTTQSTRRNFCLALGAWSASALLSRAQRGKDSLPFKLGIITDEITQDLVQALDFIASYSLAYCELREIWGKNIMNLSPSELERARQLVEIHRLQVSEIASPLFKYNLPEMPAQPSEKRDTFMASFTDQDTEDLLKRSFQIARLFGTQKVRVFSYWRVDDPEKAYPYVRERLAKAAAVAAQSHMTLLLENEFACNVGTGKELGRIIRDINSPSLRAMWDPGNAVVLNEVPYPDGYSYVRGLFLHMHVKDAERDPATGKTRWLPVGSGSVDFHGEFQALLRDGYRGTMSLETHYRRPDGNAVESTRESLEGLLKVLRSVA